MRVFKKCRQRVRHRLKRQRKRWGETLPLFAKQHGAFSTAEAATLFIAEDPSLAKAAVIHAGDNYFVWSAVGLTADEIETSEYEGTYRKTFSVNTSACGAIGAGKLREVLAETEIGQIKNLGEPKMAKILKE